MTARGDSGAAAGGLDCGPITLSAVPAPVWKLLNFKNALQERTNWCWAAVAFNVASYYDPSTAFTQCSIASGELRQDCGCCDDATDPDPCNVYGYLMSSLFRVGHFEKWLTRPATADEVHDEIDDDRPLCVRIVWNGGGAHFVVIAGYADKGSTADGKRDIGGVAIADPWWGLSDIDFEDFPTGYINCGRCTDHYETCGDES